MAPRTATFPSGHVFRVDRQRGPQWYAKFRLPDGRQVQKRIGPAWTSRGRPAAGYFTKRSAEAWLRDTLDRARRRQLPGQVLTGATFADAGAEFLRFMEFDRRRKPTTLAEYRSSVNTYLVPAFGAYQLEEIDRRMIEAWRVSVRSVKTGEPLQPRNKNKLITVLHGVFRRAVQVWDLPLNPVALIEKYPEQSSGDIEVFSPEEVMALVRAAATEQDAAIYLTAAFTGLRRGELVALRWRDVDFANHTIRVRAGYTNGQLSTPKSGKVRAVPLAPEVAEALAGLTRRMLFCGDDDLVFIGELGGHVDASALRRRYHTALDRAGLRRLRFHDLRHTFGTRVIAKADIRRVQEWMGHADVQTTMKYLHYAPRPEDAQLVAAAFARRTPDEPRLFDEA